MQILFVVCNINPTAKLNYPEMKKQHLQGRSMITLCLVLLVTCIPVKAQVEIYEKDLVLPTYQVNDPDVNPMFFKGESYQGASKYIYPYALMDNLTSERIEQVWKGLFLENEYIKLCVTPEIGGKLYWAEDKTNGYPFFYKNNVVKPANIGMLGAWVSGGIEWCVLHHHRASTFLPVNYRLAENPDGSKTIWFGEIEPRHRMKWTIGITAFPGKSYLRAEVRIFNQTAYTHSFLYWANVATHANADYQVYFPPGTEFGADHSKVDFTHWPYSEEVYRGVDYTDGVRIDMWKNHPVPTSVFAYDLKDDFMGGYDHGKEAGTVHVGNHNIVKGAKLWEWGPGELAQMWDKVLTDTDGPYAEIMVGAYSDNQPDYSWIAPYETKTITQYWYPIQDIGGIKYANLHGAVNLQVTDNKYAEFGVSVTSQMSDAILILLAKNDTVYKKQISPAPGKAFTAKVKIRGGTVAEDLRVALMNAAGEELLSYQPEARNRPRELPEVVKPPLPPGEIETVEELYLAGLRLDQFYNPKVDPMPYYKEALKRDPGNSAVNTHMGNKAMEDFRFDDAIAYYRTGIRRITHDYTRPSDCEALYGLGQALKYKGLYSAATDTLYRATWDFAFQSPAYYLLAQISSTGGEFDAALEEVEKSLTTNRLNNSARVLRAAIYRKMRNYDKAKAILKDVLEDDPLDYKAMNELYLVNECDGFPGEERSQMLIITRGDHEYFIETVTFYLNAGMYAEAVDLLDFYLKNTGEEADPMVEYYLGYLYHLSGDHTEAADHYRTASAISTDYCFPYRRESIDVLITATEYLPDHPNAYYYLGNLYYDHQPETAIYYWEKAVDADPSLAIAHRNLGWAWYRSENEIEKAIKSYESAIRLKSDDPVYYYELDRLYELNGTAPAVRLELLEPHHEVLARRNDALLREIMVLNLTGGYEKAVQYLSDYHFAIREGDMKIRDINVNAHLLLGLNYMEKEKYEDALDQFLLANTFPENQQVGRSIRDHRVAQIYYYTAKAYEALGKKKEARSYYQKCADEPALNSPFQYYRGLAMQELGEDNRAEEVFNTLVERGMRKLKDEDETDMYAKFGETESPASRKSEAHLEAGLGYAGLDKREKAKSELQLAVQLDNSNLWAGVLLDRMME